MEVTHYFDASLTSSHTAIIPIMQGDGARIIVARLLEGQNPWVVPEGVTAGLSYEIPEKTAGYYDRLVDGQPACIINRDEVSVILEPALTEQHGPVHASIVLRDTEGFQVSTFPFLLWVTQVPGMVHGDNLPAPAHAFAGKIYYGDPGGILTPLGLGAGFRTERQEDGGLFLVVDSSSSSIINPESDPTVPEWAKQPQKPAYTSEEIGADTVGTALREITSHDVSLFSHPDIRNTIETLKNNKLDMDKLPASINTALAQAKASGAFKGDSGYTPVKGVDYWTSEDQESIVQQVIAALGTPVFGRVDADRNIITTGDLVDGAYTYWYEDKNGKLIKIGTIEVGGAGYTNQIAISTDTDGSIYNATGYKAASRIGSSGTVSNIGNAAAANPVFVTGFIPVKAGDVFRMRGCYIDVDGVGDVDADAAYYGNTTSALRVVIYNMGSYEVAFTTTWAEFLNWEYVTATADGNGHVTEFTVGGNVNALIRLTLSGDPENAVLTINEEITE